jgi:hypothetical protein
VFHSRQAEQNNEKFRKYNAVKRINPKMKVGVLVAWQND